MVLPMFEKITKNKSFREDLKKYLKSQDIFNVTLNFDADDVYKICQLSNYFLFLTLFAYIISWNIDARIKMIQLYEKWQKKEKP